MWSQFLLFVLEVPLVNTVSIYVIDRKLLLRGLGVRGHFYSVLIYFRRSVLKRFRKNIKFKN